MAEPLSLRNHEFYIYPYMASDFPERVKREREQKIIYDIALATFALITWCWIYFSALPPITYTITVLLLIGALTAIVMANLAERTIMNQIKAEQEANYRQVCTEQGPKTVDLIVQEDDLEVNLSSSIYPPEAFAELLERLSNREAIDSLRINITEKAVVPAQFFVDLLVTLRGKNLKSFEVMNEILVGGYYGTLSVTRRPEGNRLSTLEGYPMNNREFQSWVDDLASQLLFLLREEKFTTANLSGKGKYRGDNRVDVDTLPNSETMNAIQKALEGDPSKKITLFNQSP